MEQEAESETTDPRLPHEATVLYRGLTNTHPGYAEALKGNAFPLGGSATAAEHNLGNTFSEFTSWTLDREVAADIMAERGQPEEGIVLEKLFYPFQMTWSPDIYNEAEILIRGPVIGAKVTKP